jgi:hypothetical protein
MIKAVLEIISVLKYPDGFSPGILNLLHKILQSYKGINPRLMFSFNVKKKVIDLLLYFIVLILSH